MKVKDPIYGQIKITEPVLIELIEAPAMQRLKGIGQEFLEQLKVAPGKNYSRFEHSIGVWHLTKLFQTPLEEQIAGLLHDVSHTAFSHTIDLVLGNESKADFHDKNADLVISNSDIPHILQKYNINTEKVTNPDNYPILEQELPALCADRLDYSLRTFFHRGLIPLSFVKETLDSLTVHQKRIVFTNKITAKKYAQKYLEAEQSIWDGNPNDVARQVPFAEILKKAMQSNIISLNDFFTQTDKQVLKKLGNENKNKIEKIAQIKTIKVEPTEHYDYHFIGKIRYVDPPIKISETKTLPLSKIDPVFKVELEQTLKKRREGNYVKIVNKDSLDL